MKKKILITGGAGFVGTNLIKLLLKKTKYKIISLDNYSSGSKKNHVRNIRVSYIFGSTSEIGKLIKNPKKNTSCFSFWRVCKNLPKFFKNERVYRV